jgi:MFS family permease
MAEPTRPRTSTSKAKPKAKAKASGRKPAPRRTPPARPAPVVEPEQGSPPSPSQPTRPARPPQRNNTLAVASLVSSIAGFTFVPVIGGFIGTLLGSLALKKERDDPSRYAAGGMAVAGVVIGFFTAVMPLLFITLFTAKRITPIPFVAVAVFGGYVFHTATRGRATTGQKFAILGGSILTTVLAVAVAIGLAFGFYFLMQLIATEVGRAIGDAFSQMFDGIGKAFDGCGDALKF